MPKDYCTQNDGDCLTCSLSNYGKDCLNYQVEEDFQAEQEDGNG